MSSILERASAAPYQLRHDEMMELLCLNDTSE